MSMMHSTVVAVLTLLTAGAPALAQDCPDPASLTRGVRAPLDVVRYLADDALGGRLAGSAGERCAGAYIASIFERMGLEPGGENGTYFQALKLESALNPHQSGGTGRNVVGTLTGSDAQLRDEVIIVGAHYDHLGMGGSGSLSPGVQAVHNGADDNASGVAALIATARELTHGQRPRRTVVFVAFTGEEMGLLGSAHFAARGAIPPARMKAMLNMDMVGRLGSGPLIVYGVGTAHEWQGLVEDAARAAGVAVATRTEGYGPSDHTSFYARDVPVLHFFTNVHGDYHQPGDDWEKIDADGLVKVARMVSTITADLASRPMSLVLVQGAGTPPAQAGEGQSRGYGAYLGSVPDFTPVARGVLLSGVSPGSPAAQAGLRSGDVILGLGQHEVADLQGMTDALRAHKPGDSVEIRFLRDGRAERVTVTLATRSR